MKGWHEFQIIGSARANDATPVIAIISHDDPKVRAMALSAGANAVLAKPINPDGLIASLKALGFQLSDPYSRAPRRLNRHCRAGVHRLKSLTVHKVWSRAAKVAIGLALLVVSYGGL